MRQPRSRERTRSFVFLLLTVPALGACGDATGPGGDAYTEDELAYFSEIAFGTEYGDASSSLHKWRDSVRIATHGAPTAEDRATLTRVVDEIDALAGEVGLALVAGEADIDVHFAPESEFSEILPEYTPTNYGFFWTWWNGADEIHRAVVLISTTEVSQRERSHLIREELTQSLGFQRDSERYEESIFYQGWTSTTEYAPIDRVLIEMLYRPELEPGMTRDEALETLRGVPRPARANGLVPMAPAAFGPPSRDRGGTLSS